MPFQIVSKEVNRLLRRQYTTNVTIDRKIYDHSTAKIVLDWDDELREGDRVGRRDILPTSELGAALLNSEVLIRWCSPDLGKAVDCFRGYISRVTTKQTTTRSYILLDCVAYTKRTDLIPRYRVWQDCSLSEVCQHISQREPLVQVLSDQQRGLSQSLINLSLQYGETDFSYLRRMLRAWGVPLALDDMEGKLVIGNLQFPVNDSPQHNWHWKGLGFSGSVSTALDKGRAFTGGPFSIAKQIANRFSRKLNRIASNYTAQVDQKNQAELMQLTANLQDAAFHSSSGYTMEWQGGVFDVRPGAILPVGSQPLYVQGVKIVGHPHEDIVSQVLDLNDQMMPIHPPEEQPRWPMRVLLGRVVRNDDGDPTQSGRVQVEFDWESLDATSTGLNRAWLPLATPYGGVAGGAAAGFLSLPEVGEHVLVQFLGDWDSQAVVIGVIRDAPCTAFKYDPHETKRWQTPSGNQITLTTLTDGATDIVRVKCRDKLVLEAKLEPGLEKVIVDVFDSETDRIHYEKKGGKAQLDIFCSGDIYMHADQKFYLEAGEIQITSTKGNVQVQSAKNIVARGRLLAARGSSRIHLDAPQLKLNCGQPQQKHWKLQPLIQPPTPPVPQVPFANQIQQAVNSLPSLGNTILESVSDGLKKLISPDSPLFEPVQNRLQKFMRRYPQFSQSLFDGMRSLADGIIRGNWKGIGCLAAQLGVGLGKNFVQDSIARLGKHLGKIVSKKYPSWQPHVNNIFDKVSSVASSRLGTIVGQTLSSLLGTFCSSLGKTFSVACTPHSRSRVQLPAAPTPPELPAFIPVEFSMSDHTATPMHMQPQAHQIAFIPPTKGGIVTSRFGLRDHPVTGEKKLHKGIDIAAPTGTPIYAAASGKVTFAGSKSGYGNVVFIDHGQGYQTRYAHCERILVSQDQEVRAGDQIATVGNTGTSTGPHLHFEIRRNGEALDPENFISFY